MATWQQFCALAPQIEGKQLGPTAWVFELPIGTTGRTQTVFASYEVIQPEFEVLRVSSPIAPIAEVNPAEALKAFGQLLAGGIGYAPNYDDAGNPADGFLTVASSIPLATLDLSTPRPFLLYLFILAGAADDTKHKVSQLG